MPSAGDMGKFDVLVVDIQDVGLRYYTYYITMQHLMDACALYGKKVIILDRPNPNGFYVDGPILDMQYASGIGSLPVGTMGVIGPTRMPYGKVVSVLDYMSKSLGSILTNLLEED